MYFSKLNFVLLSIIVSCNIIQEAVAFNNYANLLYFYEFEDGSLVRVRRSPQGELKIAGSHDSETSSLRGDVSSSLLKTDKTSINGNAYYQQNFGSDITKYQTGAGLQLNHASGTFGTLNYDRAPGSNSYSGTVGYRLNGDRNGEALFTGSHGNDMTSLRGDISGRLFKSGQTTLDGNAHYERNIGKESNYDLGAGLQLKHDKGYYGNVNYNVQPETSSFGGTAGYNRGNVRSGVYYNRNMGGMNPGHNVGLRVNVTF